MSQTARPSPLPGGESAGESPLPPWGRETSACCAPRPTVALLARVGLLHFVQRGERPLADDADHAVNDRDVAKGSVDHLGHPRGWGSNE